MARGFKTGGKVVGSKNKSTLARMAAIEEACKKIANADGSSIFSGDAQALLTLIYKTESLPLDVRMRAAESANTRERPALQAVDSNIKEEKNYIVRMPEPLKGESMDERMEDWKKRYMPGYVSPADKDKLTAVELSSTVAVAAGTGR